MTPSAQLLLPLSVPAKACKVAGASVPGARHLRQRQPCQDAARFFVERDLFCIAVADGAGSASHAALGSAAAVRAALTAVLHAEATFGRLTPDRASAVSTYAFESAMFALRNTAETLGIRAGDLACTLITVIAVPGFVFVGHVGDGAVVLSDNAGNLLTLSAPTNGEFANETPLLGSTEEIDLNLTSVAQPELRNVAVFTDGIQRLALTAPSWLAHPGFFRPLFEQLRHGTQDQTQHLIEELLSSSRVTSRTDDDTTLFVAHLP